MEIRLCSCNAYGWPFLLERRQGLHRGGEERRGEPSLKRKERRRDPLPSTCFIFCLFGSCTASLKNFARPSLTLTPLLQHVKQLHGQKHGQRAIGAKNKKNTLQSLNNNNKICAWALLIPSPASGGCDPSAVAPAQCSSGRFPTDFFYLSHGHTQCCSSSEGNHPFFPSLPFP